MMPTHPVIGSQRASRNAASGVPNAYLKHLISREPVPATPFAHRIQTLTPKVKPRPVMTFLGAHIADIVCGFPKKQVLRVHAGRIVATMQTVHSGRNWAVSQFPRNAVSPLESVANAELPVSPGKPIGRPQPTAVRSRRPIDLGPKAFLECCELAGNEGRARIGAHGEAPFAVPALGCLPHRQGIFLPQLYQEQKECVQC